MYKNGMPEILAKGVLSHSDLVNSCDLVAVTEYGY